MPVGAVAVQIQACVLGGSIYLDGNYIIGTNGPYLICVTTTTSNDVHTITVAAGSTVAGYTLNGYWQ